MKNTNFKFFAMSGKMLRKAAGVVAAALLLSGSSIHNAAISGSNVPLYLAYDSEEVLRDQSQVATITSTNGLEIDGVVVNSRNMRSTTAKSATKSVVVVDVLPGKHTVRLTNTQSLGVAQVSSVTYDFEAGRIYNVAIKLIKVVVEENTSTDVAQKIAAKRNNAVFEKEK